MRTRTTIKTELKRKRKWSFQTFLRKWWCHNCQTTKTATTTFPNNNNNKDHNQQQLIWQKLPHLRHSESPGNWPDQNASWSWSNIWTSSWSESTRTSRIIEPTKRPTRSACSCIPTRARSWGWEVSSKTCSKIRPKPIRTTWRWSGRRLLTPRSDLRDKKKVPIMFVGWDHA